MTVDCPFCQLDPSKHLFSNDLAVVIADGFPISRGHRLIIPKRHFPSLFEATEKERAALWKMLDQTREHLMAQYRPDGFNIGINDGISAGQTVLHLHIHLIPRYSGDTVDPRGGIRWVMPDKAPYWEERWVPAEFMESLMAYSKFSKKVRITILLLFSVVICIGTVTIANGQMYRWVDENGQLHFSNSPQDVPAEVRYKNSEYRPDSSSITISSDDKNSIESHPDSGNKILSEATISIPYTAKEGYANRVIIDVTFNGQITVPMMIDTGSPGLVISNSLADRLNLFDEEGGRLMVVISGIGGRKIATKTIIDELTMGEITEKFIPTHIVSGMSSSHYQGLIGMDVLSSYTMTIDPIQHKLIANLIPSAQNFPAGRNRSWWQANFKEFGFYNEYWQQQEELIGKSDSPYARLSTSRQDKIKSFIVQQKNKAAALYNKLERYARFNSVPRHWRK